MAKISFAKVAVLGALLLHAVLIYFKGYFLSIEFTLYPFLTSRGFLPYQNILDQHFPTLLFGPFSLPAFLTTNPWPLLAVFVCVLLLTDVFLYAALVRSKVSKPLVWLVLYIVSSVYFSGNILWLETFVNLLLSAWIFLSFSPKRLHYFVSGFLISQIILIRPTLIPAVTVLFFGLSLPLTIPLLLGGFVGLAIPALFLVRFGLVPDFIRLAIDFNRESYPTGAILLPAKRQVIILLAWILPTIASFIKNKKYLFLLSVIFMFVLVVPRFGYEHLQPLFLVVTLLWAFTAVKPGLLVYLLIVIVFGLNLVASIRHSYGNYFLNPQVLEISADIAKLPQSNIYLLGASDLIYPLSGKTPPNYTYLPSLPWYFNQSDFSSKVIESLSDKTTPVVVDYSATVDGYNVVESSGPIFEYIKMNLIPGPKVGSYQIFYPNP